MNQQLITKLNAAGGLGTGTLVNFETLDHPNCLPSVPYVAISEIYSDADVHSDPGGGGRDLYALYGPTPYDIKNY
jgi:hypothetical protein